MQREGNNNTNNGDGRVYADPAIISTRELRGFMTRSDAQASSHLAVFVLALAVTATLVIGTRDSVWLMPAMAVHGIILVHLFALLHECAHMTAFKTRRLNQICAWICGVVINLGPKYFQYEHTQHHTYTQTPSKDPQHIPLPASVPAYVLLLSGLPYWYGQFKSLILHAADQIPEGERRFITPSVRQEVVLEARIITAIYLVFAIVAVINGWTWPFYLWILPLLLGEPVMRFIRMTEHVGRPLTPDLTRNTRTNHAPRIMQFLAWNMNFHAEHHFAPSVPFHALPRLNERIGKHLTATAGYVDAHREIYKRVASGTANAA